MIEPKDILSALVQTLAQQEGVVVQFEVKKKEPATTDSMCV